MCTNMQQLRLDVSFELTCARDKHKDQVKCWGIVMSSNSRSLMSKHHKNMVVQRIGL